VRDLSVSANALRNLQTAQAQISNVNLSLTLTLSLPDPEILTLALTLPYTKLCMAFHYRFTATVSECYEDTNDVLSTLTLTVIRTLVNSHSTFCKFHRSTNCMQLKYHCSAFIVNHPQLSRFMYVA